MRHKIILTALFVIGSIFSLLPAASQAAPAATDLGALPGGNNSEANGISSKGTYIAGDSDTASGNFHAVLWKNGQIQDLGTLGGTTSMAMAVNESGQVVGESTTATGQPHAFLYQSGTMQDLGTIGGDFTHASAINENGVVAGYGDDSVGAYHAITWQNGSATILPCTTNGACVANGINNLNQVVGGCSSNCPTNAAALEWINGNPVSLGVQDTNGDSTSAFGINNSGIVVGSGGFRGTVNGSVAQGTSDGLEWISGQATRLNLIDDQIPSAAVAINDNGIVVGHDGFNDGAGLHEEAFIWDNGSLVQLNPFGSQTAYLDNSATGVSSDGSVVGTSTYPDGHIRAFQIPADKTAPQLTNITWSANPLLQGQSTTLSVTATDNLGVGKVQYSLDGGSTWQQMSQSSASDWEASFGSSLAPGTYNVLLQASDGEGNTSAIKKDVLAVYSSAIGYVTGHEKLTPSTLDTMPIPTDTSSTPAQLVLGFTNIKAATTTTPSSGSFQANYIVKNNQNEFDLSSNNVSWVSVPDQSDASIIGTADLTTYINGAKSVLQNVSVRFDLVLGSSGAPDFTTIKIYQPGVDPASGTPTWVISDNADQSQVLIHQ